MVVLVDDAVVVVDDAVVVVNDVVVVVDLPRLFTFVVVVADSAVVVVGLPRWFGPAPPAAGSRAIPTRPETANVNKVSRWRFIFLAGPRCGQSHWDAQATP